jgi:hypothetical protein
MTPQEIQYYSNIMRLLALEAMHLNLSGKNSSNQLVLIGLCAQAIQGDRKAIEVLKNRGIHPDAKDGDYAPL